MRLIRGTAWLAMLAGAAFGASAQSPLTNRAGQSPSTGPAPAGPATSPDLAALIECRKEVKDFMALEPAAHAPLKAVAMGWKPLPRVNPFMTEFELVKPITVFGQNSDHIAFSGDSIMAILDLPDPRPLAHQLALETGIDTPEKALFGKQLRETEQTDPVSGQTLIQAIILNVSNVASHPGKTLAGCSYNLDTQAPQPPAQHLPSAAAGLGIPAG